MESIWGRTWRTETRPSLEKHIQADVAVIGGGMAGILTAWQLKQAGVKTVVLEAERIGGGQTRNTTAKITAQHGLFCYQWIKKKGEETARKYVKANQEAVEEYKRIIRERKIDCDFRISDAYVYSADVEQLKKEVEAAQKLGVSATLERELEIPVSGCGAVRFPGQAQFHPLKFITALARQLCVYEHTPVTKVKEHLAETAGGSVRADKIVLATHFPFINFPGMYFTRMHQERSYVLALEGAGKLKGMYIGAGKEDFSFRSYDRYILLGGEAHRSGENQEGGEYAALIESAKKMFPQSTVAACWSNQDCMTTDQIPFIGQYAEKYPYWFVATGFQKWGMSSSMVAARLLRDLLCGRKNEYAEIFAPSRFSAEEIPNLLKEGGKAVKGLTKRFFSLPHKTIAALEPGQGAIVETPQGKAGVYKTKTGEIHQVNPVCPHLGCALSWNPEEHSWDCPCHGSRFDGEGKWLNGPAQEGITRE